MAKPTILHQQIQLLQDLVATLEKQIVSKEKQLLLAINQIHNLKDENEILASFIEGMKQKWDSNLQQASDEDQLTKLSYGYNNKMNMDCDINDLRGLIEQMGNQLDLKNDQISDLKVMNKELGQKLNKQQQQMKQLLKTYKTNETKLLHRISDLQKSGQQLKNKQNSKICFSRLESKKGLTFQQLQNIRQIKVNTEIIEKSKSIIGTPAKTRIGTPAKTHIKSPESVVPASKASNCCLSGRKIISNEVIDYIM